MTHFKQNQECAWGVTKCKVGKIMWVRCVSLKYMFSSGYWILKTGKYFLLYLNFIPNVVSAFYYQIYLYSPFFSQGNFSIEIRCPEYITVTSSCQHWFPFLLEICCWNPLQADKYLYTWLPDLIAFCKGGCIGVTLSVCHSTLYSSSVMPYYAPHRALI